MDVLFVLLIVAIIVGALFGFDPFELLLAVIFFLVPYVFYIIFLNAYN
jgi:hypothetical protein